MVKILVEKGANIHAPTQVFLYLFIYLFIYYLIINYPKEINQLRNIKNNFIRCNTDKKYFFSFKLGGSPLYISAQRGHERIAKILLKKGVNINTPAYVFIHLIICLKSTSLIEPFFYIFFLIGWRNSSFFRSLSSS